MPPPSSSKLFIPGVSVLIAFLAYSSQYLFLQLEPAFETRTLVKFNLPVACIWICYYRACFTDPGRLPKDWRAHSEVRRSDAPEDDALLRRRRWCKKCQAPKPPRAHHCKQCRKWVALPAHSVSLLSTFQTDCMYVYLPQMYPQDGSSLPLDGELCFPHHLSTLHPLSILCCGRHDISGISALSQGSGHLGESTSTECESI